MWIFLLCWHSIITKFLIGIQKFRFIIYAPWKTKYSSWILGLSVQLGCKTILAHGIPILSSRMYFGMFFYIKWNVLLKCFLIFQKLQFSNKLIIYLGVSNFIKYFILQKSMKKKSFKRYAMPLISQVSTFQKVFWGDFAYFFTA